VLAEVDAVIQRVHLASSVLLRSSAWLWTGTLAAIAPRSSSPARNSRTAALGREGERREEGKGASWPRKNHGGAGRPRAGRRQGRPRAGGDAGGTPIYANYSQWDF
jgi:hypothetical protein